MNYLKFMVLVLDVIRPDRVSKVNKKTKMIKKKSHIMKQISGIQLLYFYNLGQCITFPVYIII